MSCESSSELSPHDKDTISSWKQSSKEEMHAQSNLTEPLAPTLEEIVANGSDQAFQIAMPEISERIKTGKDEKFICNKVLHYRLLQTYYGIYKNINESEGEQEKMLFLLSLLAEITRQNNQIRLPFSKKTVLSLLNFDESAIFQVKGAHQIFIILMILFENMARQGKLMVRLGVEEQLKRGLLLLIGKADEYSALQISLRTLLELQAKAKVNISTRELQQTGIIERIQDNFGKEAVQKIKEILCRQKIKKIETVSKMTLFELVSNK